MLRLGQIIQPMVEAIVRAALARIEGAVGKRETVNLVGFGHFEVYERGARRGRNLRTGESLKIRAIRAVRFKIGKRLRDAAAGSKRRRPRKDRK
jgi:DNA-binding protein HU-beta